MNRIKRELISKNLYHLADPDCLSQYYVDYSCIEYYADFERVRVYWNVITIDYILDKHFNRIDVAELKERNLLTGKTKRAEAFEKFNIESIREYPNGLKIYEIWNGNDFEIVFAET